MIQRLYVHNYRCLENFELALADLPSSLLIGKNGSGKSTVAQALWVLRSIASGKRLGEVLTRTDFSRGRSDVPIRFEVEAKLGGRIYHYRLAAELPSGFREFRIREEGLRFDGHYDYFSREQAQVVLAGEREARFLVDWHLPALPIIQARPEEEEPLRTFRRWLSAMLILAPVPSLITGDSSGETLVPDRTVRNFGEWFSGLLRQWPSAYSSIERYLKQVMPDFSAVDNREVGREAHALSVRFQGDQGHLEVPFQNLSDGEKCFFVCALVLAAVNTHGPLFCFWDEPDSHLALSEVGHFVLDLRRAFQAEGHRGQLVVTSHTPEAIRRFSEENTLLLYREGHFDPTRCERLQNMQVPSDLVGALTRDDLVP
ncbi:MAG: AAA family ATPase [Candidatus Eremiobacterota bacterium]